MIRGGLGAGAPAARRWVAGVVLACWAGAAWGVGSRAGTVAFRRFAVPDEVPAAGAGCGPAAAMASSSSWTMGGASRASPPSPGGPARSPASSSASSSRTTAGGSGSARWSTARRSSGPGASAGSSRGRRRRSTSPLRPSSPTAIGWRVSTAAGSGPTRRTPRSPTPTSTRGATPCASRRPTGLPKSPPHFGDDRRAIRRGAAALGDRGA
jgi:hypothetical protein